MKKNRLPNSCDIYFISSLIWLFIFMIATKMKIILPTLSISSNIHSKSFQPYMGRELHNHNARG